MLIEIKDIVNNANGSTEEKERGREWLSHEILRSIPMDLIEPAKMKGNVNILLSIDGVLVEPELLQDMFLRFEEYIDNEAKAKAKIIIEENLQEIDARFNNVFGPLEDAVQKAKRKILRKMDYADIEKTDEDYDRPMLDEQYANG